MKNKKYRMQSDWDLQAKLLYSLIVAGKSANFTDRAMRNLLVEVCQVCGCRMPEAKNGETWAELSFFDMFAALTHVEIFECLRAARTGNYGKLLKAILQLIAADFDLRTVTSEQLETIHGIGPKSSRFYLVWTRPQERHAVLDVHVLRWMRQLGYDAPKQTPTSGKKYQQLEQQFIAEADKRGMTPRQLDSQIWERGAGRTQLTPLPGM